MKNRNLYLTNVTVEEALQKFFKASGTPQPPLKLINVKDSLARVTAEPVIARYNSPMYDCAAMDGIAVISADTYGASESAPITLSNFKIVDTGDPIPLPYDAVIMAENIQEDGKNYVIREPATPWQHIRPVGEDIVAGEMIVPSNHKIRPFDIAVLLSGGITQISVKKFVTVAIIPTGTELIEPHSKNVPYGSIIESNSYMLEGLLREENAVPTRFGIVEDDYELIKANLKHAVDTHDMVLLCSGTSAGTEDYTVHVIKELGEVVTHGVAIKPGKPTVLGIVNGKPVIGVPGYPVSAYIAYENFVKPIVNALAGTKDNSLTKKVVNAAITRRMVSSLKHKEFVRVKVGKVGEKLIATPVARGAGAAMSLVRADGFCVIPQDVEGFEAGTEVPVILSRDSTMLENTLISIGSHDLMLDILSDMLPLSSTHVGSMGGLMALKNRETHIAPIHQLDEDSGEYNIPFLKKLFADEQVVLIKGATRTQGIMVQKGNPKNITSLADLKENEKNVRFINRQRGSGTRMLLDYKLKTLGIKPEEITGYDREATTHMTVAASVKNGSACAGIGIQSAAIAMGLDFIPIGEEEYDFATWKAFLDLPSMQSFIETLKSPEFKEKLNNLQGYGTNRLGEVCVVGV